MSDCVTSQLPGNNIITDNSFKYSAENSGNNKKNKNVTCIIGDSILKDVKGWELTKSMKHEYVTVKSFSGAKTECMKHYIIPTLDKKPDKIILHVGTNDLRDNVPADEVADRVMALATECSKTSTILISAIVTRGDVLRGKAVTVNDILKHHCNRLNIGFIEHENIKLTDLNNSQLHLNRDGSQKLSGNFLHVLGKF